MGSSKRLSDIEQGIKHALRLKHIQEGLESRKWGGPLACVSNRPTHNQAATAPSTSVPPRLDGELALRNTLTPEKPSTSTSNRLTLKRPSALALETEPPAKRPKSLTQSYPGQEQQVESNSHSPAASSTVARPAPSADKRRKIKLPSNRVDALVSGGMDLVAKFFAEYRGFRYNPSASVWAEFYRMVNLFRWDKLKRDEAREELRNALTQQFNSLYGTDVQDVKNWQLLCRVLEIFPVPEDLDECRHKVINTHVNLVDLTTRTTNDPVQRFKTELELSVYTKATKKYFPRDDIHAGGLLKFLLRQIINPPSEGTVRLSGRLFMDDD